MSRSLFIENKCLASKPSQHYGNHVQFMHYETISCVKKYFCDMHF